MAALFPSFCFFRLFFFFVFAIGLATGSSFSQPSVECRGAMHKTKFLISNANVFLRSALISQYNSGSRSGTIPLLCQKDTNPSLSKKACISFTAHKFHTVGLSRKQNVRMSNMRSRDLHIVLIYDYRYCLIQDFEYIFSFQTGTIIGAHMP